MSIPVLIVGAGGFGRAVAQALRGRQGLLLLGFLDDRAAQLPEVDGLPVLGVCADVDSARQNGAQLVLAIGSNVDRERLGRAGLQAGLTLLTVVHHQAWVADNARVGAGSIVMAGAVVGAGVRLGLGCIVNYGAVLDHDCQVQDFARIGAGASLGGGARLGARAHVHEGAVLPAGFELPTDAALLSPFHLPAER